VTKEQLQALAAAYGGDLSRWPAAWREEAALFAAAEPKVVQAVLAREARLDAALDAWPRAPASSALFETIVASAPPMRQRRSQPRWRWWLAPATLGAVLASVAAAGVILGVQVSERSSLSPEQSAQSVADLDVSAVSEEG